MIKLIVVSTLLNTGEIVALPLDTINVEARRRNGKGQRGRRRGGSGLK